MEKQLVRQFFAAYHVNQVNFKTQEDLKQVFVANGVDGKQFDELMGNAQISNEAQSMMALWEEKQIESVPTIVVNGKYRINMGKLKSLDELKSITELPTRLISTRTKGF